ncbi:hypothetical protein FS837_002544 [Tulasnella sp. UAMH 9824]|nr:hypothetical protein FS837_002544 [Tulasnella sp. UAMH 9824]
MVAGILATRQPTLAAIPTVPTSLQTAFPINPTHASSQNLWKFDIGSLQGINIAGKELIVFENNTASCHGFAVVSDSYSGSLPRTSLNFHEATFGIIGIPPSITFDHYLKLLLWASHSLILDLGRERSGEKEGGQVIDVLRSGKDVHTLNLSSLSLWVKRSTSAASSSVKKITLARWVLNSTRKGFQLAIGLQDAAKARTAQCNPGTSTATVKPPRSPGFFGDHNSIEPGLSVHSGLVADRGYGAPRQRHD